MEAKISADKNLDGYEIIANKISLESFCRDAIYGVSTWNRICDVIKNNYLIGRFRRGYRRFWT